MVLSSGRLELRDGNFDPPRRHRQCPAYVDVDTVTMSEELRTARRSFRVLGNCRGIRMVPGVWQAWTHSLPSCHFRWKLPTNCV